MARVDNKDRLRMWGCVWEDLRSENVGRTHTAGPGREGLRDLGRTGKPTLDDNLPVDLDGRECAETAFIDQVCVVDESDLRVEVRGAQCGFNDIRDFLFHW